MNSEVSKGISAMSESSKEADRFKGLHEEFSRHHLRGLWQREVSSSSPLQPHLWSWKEISPILERALKTVRLPEDIDQRVIGLNAPGLSNRALSMAYQLLNRGEEVASHRHTPAQMRFIIQGTGAYTMSEGERMFMEPGDLLVQPNWTWHGSANIGEGPVLWLDIQDRNLINYLGAFLRELWPNGEVEPATHPDDYHQRLLGALRPAQASPSASIQPPFRYRWGDTLKTLDELTESDKANPHDGVVFEYTNPLTGGHTTSTMSAQMQLLRPSESTSMHRHTGTAMYHVVKGKGATTINGETLHWQERDCFIIPPLQWHSHRNGSTNERAVLFTVNDRPLLEALGLYREEGR